jgi:hypothetical protein
LGLRGIEEEPQQDLARPAEHHDKGHQGALGPPDGALGEMGPVDLGLLPRQGLEAQIRLGLRPGPVVQHRVAKAVRAARVTALAHQAA